MTTLVQKLAPKRPCESLDKMCNKKKLNGNDHRKQFAFLKHTIFVSTLSKSLVFFLKSESISSQTPRALLITLLHTFQREQLKQERFFGRVRNWSSTGVTVENLVSNTKKIPARFFNPKKNQPATRGTKANKHFLLEARKKK